MLNVLLLGIYLPLALGQLMITYEPKQGETVLVNCSANFEWQSCVIGIGTVENQKWLCRHHADSNDLDHCSNTLMLTNYANPKQGWCSIRKAEFDIGKDSPWFCIMKDTSGRRFEMETGGSSETRSSTCANINSSLVLILSFLTITLQYL